jgi:hypothetical protein
MNLYGLNPYLPDPEENDRSITALAAAANGGDAQPIADPQPYDPGPPQTYDEPQLRAPDHPQMAPKLDNVRSLGSDVGAPSTGDSQSEAGGGDAPGVSGWALAADILLNRGRGLGGIIAQAEKQKQDFQREQEKRQAQALERKDRSAQNQLGWENARLRGDEIKLSRDREQSAADAEKTKLDMLQHPENYPLSHSEQIRKDEIAAMNGERDTDNKRADAQLEELRRHNLASEGNDSARIAAAGKDGGLTPYQQHEIERQGQLDSETKANKEAGLAQSYTDKTKFARASAASLAEVDAIVKKYGGKDVPGLGAAASMTPDWVRGLKGAYDNMTGDTAAAERNADAQTVTDALSNLSQSVLRKETGAAAAPSEQTLTKIRTGSGAGRSEEQALEAIRLMRDLSYGDLRAYSSGRDDIARDVIKKQGLNVDDIFGASPAAAAAVIDDAPPSARNAMPKMRQLKTDVQIGGPNAGESEDDFNKRFGQYRIGGR